MKYILVLGSESYIGSSFQSYLTMHYPEAYQVDAISLKNEDWKAVSFSKYDAVFDCVGMAHLAETAENRAAFFQVNRDLAVEAAKKAKEDGAGQFVLMSSMSVYGKTTGTITKQTVPQPSSAYGQSKLEAEEALRAMENESFAFACIRAPMIYGKGCLGNYRKLEQLALKLPVFPNVRNQRSMLYIDNLCEFVRLLIDRNASGIFFPQNKEYVCTSDLAMLIAKENGKKRRCCRALGWLVKVSSRFAQVLQKAFGSLVYAQTEDFDYSYCVYDLPQSIHNIYKTKQTE